MITTAEELLKNKESFDKDYPTISIGDAIEMAIELAKLHVTKALDQAFLSSEMRVSENNTNETPSFTDNYDDGYVTITVSKSSILDAYPLDNIK